MESYEKAMPANIRNVYELFQKQSLYGHKMELLFAVYTQLFRYIGCILLSEYMEKDDSNNKINAEINRLLRPSLGNWLGFIRVYLKNNEKDVVFISEIYAALQQCQGLKYETCKDDFRSRERKMNDPISAILELRNMIAHGALPPDENEAGELLTIYEPCFHAILEAFQPVFEHYRIGKLLRLENGFFSDRVVFEIVGSDEEKNEYHIDLEESRNVIPSKLYLIREDNELLRISDFFVDAFLGEYDDLEKYYMFDGVSNKSVIYTGSIYKKHIEQYLEAIREKFMSKKIEMKWKKEGFSLEGFLEYINEISGIAVSQHIASGKYNPKVYVERRCDYIVNEFLNSDKTTLMIKAEAGVGKTSFLCHTMDKVIEKGEGAYFINGSSLTDCTQKNAIFEKLRADCLDEKAFHTIYDFLQTMNDFEQTKHQFIIMIDAVNEAFHIENILEEIETLTAYGDKYSWLKVIVSIRTISYEIFRNRIIDEYGKVFPLFKNAKNYFTMIENGKLQRELEVTELTISEEIEAFRKYRDYYHLDEIQVLHRTSKEIQTLIRNPLNMSLYFQILNQRNTGKVANEEDLFSEYHNNVKEVKTLSQSLEKLLFSIINEMYNIRCNYLNLDKIMEFNQNICTYHQRIEQLILLSPYERLKDMGILYEYEKNGIYEVGVVYQKYLEYLFKQYINNLNLSQNGLVEQFVLSSDWHELKEAHMAYYKLLQKRAERYEIIIDVIATIMKYQYSLNQFRYSISHMIFELLVEKTESAEDYHQLILDTLARYDILDWAIEIIEQCYREEEISAAKQLAQHVNLYQEKLTADEKRRIFYVQGLIEENNCNMEKAIQYFEQCIDLSFPEEKGIYQIEIAKTYRKDGNLQKAKDIIYYYLQNDSNDTNSIQYAEALAQKGLCHFADEEWEKALTEYLHADEIAIKQKDNLFRLYNLLGISAVYNETGQLEESKKLLLEIYADTKRLGYQNLLIDSMNGLAAVSVLQKQYDEAIDWAKEGLMMWEYSGFYRGQMVMHCHIINAMYGKGEPYEKVIPHIEQCENLKSKVKEKVILRILEKALLHWH